LVFFQRCVPQAERDVPLGRDVCFASDVRFAREEAEHITSLCGKVAIHHCAIALHHFGAADTSLFTNKDFYVIINLSNNFQKLFLHFHIMTIFDVINTEKENTK
jgi:hypothetical protein